MAASKPDHHPKVLVPKAQYEGLLASQQQQQLRDRKLVDEEAASLRAENETIRRDVGEAEPPKEAVCCPPASPSSSCSNDDDDDSDGKVKETDPYGGEPCGVRKESDDVFHMILPCRRKKQAARYLERVTKNPEARLSEGQIWFKNKSVGKIPTVLSHLFGTEKLSGRQARMASSLLHNHLPSKSQRPSSAEEKKMKTKKKKKNARPSKDFLNIVRRHNLE